MHEPGLDARTDSVGLAARSRWRGAPTVHALLTLLLALPMGLAAQRPAPPASPPVPRAIREIKEVDLRRDLFAMASPAMRGREGGTLDEMRASMWVAEMYRQIGLKPAGDDGTWYQWFNIIRTRVSVTSSRATIAGQSLTLLGDVIPLSAVPVEATGPVLWLADPSDTTTEVRGRIVATLLRVPTVGSIRPTSYPAGVRYANAAIAGTLARLTARGAAAILLVANAPVDSAFDAIAVMRQRGDYDVDRATPRAAGQSDRVSPPPTTGQGPTPALLCCHACVDDGARESKLWREVFMGLAVILVLHPFLVKVAHFGHCEISFARFKASSISRLGVFCDFLMKTRTTTTRLPTAVT